MPEHARRIKIRRKALRQPDEFHTLTNQAMAWLDTHRELAAGIALALLVAAAAVLAVSQYRASQVGRAAESFRSAQATFEAGRFADAAAAFEMLGETFPRTPSGRLAGPYRAHALPRHARKSCPGLPVPGIRRGGGTSDPRGGVQPLSSPLCARGWAAPGRAGRGLEGRQGAAAEREKCGRSEEIDQPRRGHQRNH